jgi:hypothetical protein
MGRGIFWGMNFTIFIMCNTSVGLGKAFFFFTGEILPK